MPLMQQWSFAFDVVYFHCLAFKGGDLMPQTLATFDGAPFFLPCLKNFDSL